MMWKDTATLESLAYSASGKMIAASVFIKLVYEFAN